MKPQEILPAFTGKAHIKKLIAYAKPYAKLLWAGLFCMIVVACASAASAKLMKPIINDIFVDRNKDMLMPVTLGIFAIFFAKGLFTYGESVLMSKVGNRIIADIQKDLFHKVIYADLRFYFSIQSGDLVSRFMNDVAKLNTAVTGTISNIGKDFLTLLFFIAVMFDEDWHLALIVFFVLPIAILPVVKIGRYMRKAAKRIQEHTSDLTVYLTQAFQGIRLIKSYRLEAYETGRIYQAIEDVFARTLKGVRMKAASHPIMEFLGGVAIATVIVYGGKEVINGTQTPGAFFAFITALIMSYEPLKRLANLNANLQEQLAAADRIFGLMAYQNQIQDSARAKDLKISRGDINIDNVAFYYNPGQPVLREINFKIPAGQKIALVGPSGGGKSTLMNLLLRFFDPSSGQILIDDHPLKEYTLNSLRDQIAMVSQDVVLFDDTIEANIRFGNPNATLEQIQEAAKAAAAHDFIVEFPQGYQTQVGEQGTRLSGGQRQRISIARAMLKQAPILLLDEPTSALDSQSETIIQEALARLMKGKTTLVIAHRLATVRDADCIYLMEHGLISAFGTHEVLMKKSSLYQDLCRKQFAE